MGIATEMKTQVEIFKEIMKYLSPEGQTLYPPLPITLLGILTIDYHAIYMYCAVF